MRVMACAVSLAGCAGSSNNGAAVTGGAPAPGYGADGTLSATVASNAFASSATERSPGVSQAADALTAVAKPGNSAYKIGPLDVLDVTVFKVPDLNKTVQVAEDGTISYPLIGDVRAAGRTANELARDLTQKLGVKYLRDPQVSVFVKDFNSQRVTISGSVKTSGVYALKGVTTLMQVVAMAGDVDTSTDSGNVVIFRTVDGRREAARFDMDAIRAGQANDPQVQPGDVIVVDSSVTKVALHNVLVALPLASTAAVFAGL